MFSFSGDGQCYRTVYIVYECCYLILVWMIRGKMNNCISACGFSIYTYLNVVVISVYGKVQIIYCVIFLYRHFELKVFVYFGDLI